MQDTKGAVGYVDYSDAVATELRFAAVANKAGDYVAPTLGPAIVGTLLGQTPPTNAPRTTSPAASADTPRHATRPTRWSGG